MGEFTLDIIVDRMRHEFKVEANIGAPQVAYRETFTQAADVEVNSYVSLSDVDNTDTYGSNLNHKNQVLDTSSWTL